MGSSDELLALEEWYAAQCDGEWEHGYGISIETLDNPGWWIKVDLVGTRLESRSAPEMVLHAEGMSDVADPNTPERWIVCEIEGRQFHGAGDPSRLTEILRRFLEWARYDPAA